MLRCILPVATTLLFAATSAAQTFEFRSKLDKFTVTVQGKRATLDGQSASVAPMDGVFTLFGAEFADACDMSDVGKPDLTITRTTNTGVTTKRLVFIDRRLVSNGQSGCGSLSGQGLYMLPFHRKWFTTDDKVTIALRNKFSIWKDDKKIAEFERTPDGFRNTDPNFFTNWEFFEKFVFALKEFPIDFRAHPDAAKDFTGFELRDAERTFKFVKVGEKTWAVQFPGVPWLAASGQLGVFGDMNPNIWVSPHEKTLRILRDRTAKENDRLKAATAVFDTWVPDVREVFYEVLLSEGDSVSLRRNLSTLLKQKPTDENFRVLLRLIKKEQDTAMVSHVTRILRVKNPKGPVVLEEDDDMERDKKVAEWLSWGRSSGILKD